MLFDLILLNNKLNDVIKFFSDIPFTNIDVNTQLNYRINSEIKKSVVDRLKNPKGVNPSRDPARVILGLVVNIKKQVVRVEHCK